MKTTMMRTTAVMAGELVLAVVAAMALTTEMAVAQPPVTEYSIPTAGSYPYGITAGPDGNLWFTESNSNKIAKLTTAGSITEYRIPTADSAPMGITAGPDGNLWFTEYGGNKIGKVTTAGTFTEYPIPTAISLPEGITAGPDGNLWFTESGNIKIGKVTTGLMRVKWSAPRSWYVT